MLNIIYSEHIDGQSNLEFDVDGEQSENEETVCRMHGMSVEHTKKLLSLHICVLFNPIYSGRYYATHTHMKKKQQDDGK